MHSHSPACIFCEKLVRGNPEALWDRLLAETPEFIITPTKGALTPGWLLVTSKEHELCTGALGQNRYAGLVRAIALAEKMVLRRFGTVTIFEHGPAFPGSALGCGIDHLHVHVAPLKFGLKNAFSSMFPDTNWQCRSEWQDLAAVHSAGTGYVAVQEPGSRLAWSRAPEGIRQPLRRVIAKELRIGDRFDYREYPELINVRRTIEAFT